MPLRIKTTLKKILLVLRIFKKSVPMLFAEYVYFNKAKLAALDKEKYRSDLKGILLRKRTHHLERVLWQPSRYPKAYGEETGADLETLTQIDLSGVTDKIQGWSKKILREYKKAQIYIEKAIEKDPNNFLFFNNLALQYRFLGNYDEAIKCLKKGEMTASELKGKIILVHDEIIKKLEVLQKDKYARLLDSE
jgi:tetratricopeptide (TPR) repeat protein